MKKEYLFTKIFAIIYLGWSMKKLLILLTLMLLMTGCTFKKVENVSIESIVSEILYKQII